jgi:outer membrane protein OmpU
VKYALDLGGTTLNLGAGYMSTDFGVDTGSLAAVSVDAAFGGGFSAGIAYASISDDGGIAGQDYTHVAVGIGYETGPVSLHANYGEFDSDSPTQADDSGFGLSAAYDLGGGLSANLGYGSSDFEAGGTSDSWSLGMVMSF